jgi:hypothetical protein
MSFPPPITGLKLRVSTGSDTYEQAIPSASLGNNSMQIMPNTVVFNAFNANSTGTIFTPSIVANYGSDELGNAVSAVSTPSIVTNFVPKKITTTLSLSALTNKSTIDSPFSLSGFVTTNSTGVLSYESSAPSVATVNPSTGLVTIVGAGTTTITVSQAASANGVYTAAVPVSQQLVVLPTGFSVLTNNNDFTSLDFDLDMTTLFTNRDEDVKPITMPNSNFTFDNKAYTTLYAGSNGWFSFGTNVAEVSFGDNTQQPINTFRYFGRDHVSTGSYKFVSNNTRLLFKLTGYIYGATTKTFTIKVIIEQSGEIRINYTLAQTFTSDGITIGYVGGNSSATSDDTFLTLDGVTFNRSISSNLFSLLNGKTILYIPPNYPTFGSFTLPSDIQVYQNQTITRVLTPPTSNSSGAFTFTSSNTAVATITVNNGVSSINVVGGGTTIIAATQAASGGYDSSSVTASLTVTVVLPTFGPFTLPSDIPVYQNQTITRVLTPPSSNSSGAFTFTSSNTAVATISISGGVSSINVIGGGTTTITAIQALSGIYASSSVTASLTVTVVLPTFGTFSLPSHELVYQNQTITRPLTPPTSNSSGAFTFTSSNTAVATISISGGVSSINVIGAGSTIITATQAASGIYASLSSSVILDTIKGIIFGTIWRQLSGDIDGQATGDNSGRYVHLSADGTTLAVGANGNDGNGGNAGHVRVYMRDPNKTTAVTDQSSSNFGPIGWTRIGADIDGEAIGDLSGSSVSLSANGNILAIGAYNNDGNGSNAGHVRVYMRDPNKTTAVTNQSSSNFGPIGWTRLGGDIDGEAASDFSGYSVSLSADGNIVAIGADNNDGNGSNAGHVRVYMRDPNKTTAVIDQSSSNFGPIGWTRLGGDIDGEAANDFSGYSVSLSANGTILAIGAWLNDGNGSNAGHVRVYTRDTNKTTAVTDQSSPNFGPVGWTRIGGDIDGEAAGDQSGYSVSLSADGNIVAIAATGNDGTTGVSTDSRGHVRVYMRDPNKTTAVTNQSSSNFGPIGWTRLGGDIDGEAAGDQSGYSVSLSADGNIVAIAATGNDGNGTNAGHVRVYMRDPNKTTAVTDQSSSNFGPIGWRRLGGDIDGEAANDQSGVSVSLSANGTILAIGAPFNDGNGVDSGQVRVYNINYPTFGTFTLPTDIQVYQNQTITRVLTPPTSNSSGAFTFTSSNTAVATITVNDGVSNINVIGGGTTTITATQAASGGYASSSVTASLTVTVVLPTFGPFTLPSDIQVYQNQTITRTLTPPTSNSLGAFTFTSSNTAVATITVNDGVSSINVIGGGTTTITATQAASGGYASSSVTASLTVTVVLPTFGTFTLPSDELVYQNQTITRVLMPPTSNSSGAFTFTSSNTAVATISVSGGVSSINVIGAGSTIITATQAASGIYASSSSSVILDTIKGIIFGTIWRQLSGDIDGQAAGDQSGWSISLSADGNTLAIGAPNNDGNGSNAGHVRVYTRDTNKTTAVTDQTLSNFGPVGWTRLGGDIDGEAPGDQSGWSVSLSVDGNIIAIGAAINDGNGSDAGHVRVYMRDPNKTTAVTAQSSSNFGPVGWTRIGADIDGEAIGDFSGVRVSLSADGNIVAIAAYNNDGTTGVSTDNRGHVRVYMRDPNKTTAVTDQSSPNFGPVGWTRIGGDIDGEAAGDYSGVSVSLSANGNILAIGADGNGGNGSFAGHVRVYIRDPNKTTAVTDQSSPNFGPVGWTRIGGDIDGEAASDFSGVRVSLSADGTTLAVGAWLNDGNGSNAGHVRVYTRDTNKTTAVTDQSSPNFGPVGWTRLGGDIDGEAAGDQSGYSVSLSADGNIVAIAAYLNDGNGSDAGHVRVYIRNPNKTTAVTDQSSPNFGPVGWTRIGADIDGEAAFDTSGRSVSLSSDGTTLAIGAPANDGTTGVSTDNRGHVRVYNINYPTFGTFTLPTDIQVYQNQTITRVLTPPSSNSSGAFTFTSSNTAVATITVNDGVSNINVIGGGTTTITATQAASGGYASSSVTASLTVTVVLPTFGTFTLPYDELVYQNQTITRVLTPPTSNSSGAFTFTSSNTAVATITVNNGVSSINVIGAGITAITATQAASGDYASSSVAVSLYTVTGREIPPVEDIIEVQASATDPKILRVLFSVENNRNPIGNTNIYLQTFSSGASLTATVVQGEIGYIYYATINTGIFTVNNTSNILQLVRVRSINGAIVYSQKSNVLLGPNF